MPMKNFFRSSFEVERKQQAVEQLRQRARLFAKRVAGADEAYAAAVAIRRAAWVAEDADDEAIAQSEVAVERTAAVRQAATIGVHELGAAIAEAERALEQAKAAEQRERRASEEELAASK